MSFLELWGESIDPGERGSIELSDAHEPCRWKLLVWARMLFLLVALPIVWGVSASLMTYFSIWEALGLVIGITCVYVAVAFFVRPEPNLDNAGLMGFMVDHPTRWSDDWNRCLMDCAIVLGPGRFVAETIVDFALMFQEDRQRHDLAGLPVAIEPDQCLAAYEDRRFVAEQQHPAEDEMLANSGG